MKTILNKIENNKNLKNFNNFPFTTHEDKKNDESDTTEVYYTLNDEDIRAAYKKLYADFYELEYKVISKDGNYNVEKTIIIGKDEMDKKYDSQIHEALIDLGVMNKGNDTLATQYLNISRGWSGRYAEVNCDSPLQTLFNANLVSRADSHMKDNQGSINKTNVLIECANKYHGSRVPNNWQDGGKMAAEDTNFALETEIYPEFTYKFSNYGLGLNQLKSYNKDNEFEVSNELLADSHRYEYGNKQKVNFEVKLTFIGENVSTIHSKVTFPVMKEDGTYKNVSLNSKCQEIKNIDYYGSTTEWGKKKKQSPRFNTSDYDYRKIGFNLFVHRAIQAGQDSFNKNLADLKRKADKANAVAEAQKVNGYQEHRWDDRVYSTDFTMFVADEDGNQKAKDYFWKGSADFFTIELQNGCKLIYCESAAKEGRLELLGYVSPKLDTPTFSADKVMKMAESNLNEFAKNGEVAPV